MGQIRARVSFSVADMETLHFLLNEELEHHTEDEDAPYREKIQRMKDRLDRAYRRALASRERLSLKIVTSEKHRRLTNPNS